MPNIDFNSINTLNLIKPLQIHICMWVYCAISTCWLISSITLLTSMFADFALIKYNIHIISANDCPITPLNPCSRCSLCEPSECQLFFIHLDLLNGWHIDLGLGVRRCFRNRLRHIESKFCFSFIREFDFSFLKSI